jgi:hypothetical protein
MRMWPAERARELERKILALAGSPTLRFAFHHTIGEKMPYFPEQLESELASLSGQEFQYVPVSQGLATCDIVIISAHGENLKDAIWSARQSAPNALIALWLWDNHVAYVENLQTALAVDFVFPSHLYKSTYLANPVSVLASHVPACSAQWTRAEAAQIFASDGHGPRSPKLLANYVDYEFSPRAAVLARLKKEAPEVDVMIMPQLDRSRYFGKSRADRLKEWLSYKACLVLPVDKDVSTRVFDALLAGLVILAPSSIADFDSIIKPEIQAALGVIRLPDTEVKTIRRSAREAVQSFDAAGERGASERHRYALENHMLIHRIQLILRIFKQVVGRKLVPAFASEKISMGLYLVAR